MNLLGALDAGIATATLRHPWNAEVCEDEDILCAGDWEELGRLLAPRLEAART